MRMCDYQMHIKKKNHFTTRIYIFSIYVQLAF